MTGRIRKFFCEDYAALVFHNKIDSKRVFPYLIGFGWRDDKGFNPTFIYRVTQTGDKDPHLLPYGYRTISGSFYLFGNRWGDEEAA